MATTDKRLCKGVFGSSNATLYTTPALTMALVKAITICNKTNATRNFTIKFASTEVVQSHNITAYNTLTIPFMDQILNAAELIEGSADSAASVNYYISGKEVV
jgi:hypothetical protein